MATNLISIFGLGSGIVLNGLYGIDNVEVCTACEYKSGSCAIVALFVEKKVFIVNVGDSRAIMSCDGGNYCTNLSLDHKPNDEIE